MNGCKVEERDNKDEVKDDAKVFSLNRGVANN